MDRNTTCKAWPSALGALCLSVASSTVGFVVALLKLFVNMFAVTDLDDRDARRLHDSDLSGELNHRTGRLDSGLDPYGWYDRD